MAQQTTQRGTTHGDERKPEAEETRTKTDSHEPIGRVIEIIGNSQESFDDAIRSAVNRANQTLRHITGIEVQKMSAKVRDGELREFRVDLKLAFGMENPKGPDL